MTLTLQAPLETLTPEEERDRLLLERQVERSSYRAWKALAELRDRRLFRDTYPSWDAYLKDRFGIGRHMANNQIRAAEIFESILQQVAPKVVTSGHQERTGRQESADRPTVVLATSDRPALETGTAPEMETSGHQPLEIVWEQLPADIVLPANERQMRAMANVREPLRGQVWEAAVSAAGGKQPSSAEVERAVQGVIATTEQRTPTPNPFRIGQACTLRTLGDPDLRGMGGCVAIVKGVNEVSCNIRTGLGDRLVHRHNLEGMDLSAPEEQQMAERCDRLSRLNEEGEKLGTTGQMILKELSKRTATALSPLEEQILGLMEAQLGIEVGDAEAESEAATAVVEAKATNPVPASPVRTSPPDRESIEERATVSDPPDPASSSLEEDDRLVEGDPVRTLASHPNYPDLQGTITQIDERIATVQSQGGEIVKIPLWELEKMPLPMVIRPANPTDPSSG